MPKSKREKIVSLTKVKKKTRVWKAALIEKVRSLCDEYDAIYVVQYANFRNETFKQLREDVQDTCTFVLGSNKKLQAALGSSEATEAQENVRHLSPHLRGPCGLLFTTLAHEDVVDMARGYRHDDYARAGARAAHTVTLPGGPVIGPRGEPMPHSMERTLRACGLPTRLNKGVIELLSEHVVCKAGEALTPHQAALLRQFEVKMSECSLRLKAVWRGGTKRVDVLGGSNGSGDEGAGASEEIMSEEEGGGLEPDFKLDNLDAMVLLPAQ